MGKTFEQFAKERRAQWSQDGLDAERIFRGYYRAQRENPIPPFQANFETIDETGFIWAWLDEADDPSLIVPGAVLVLYEGEDDSLAEVVDLVPAANGTIVHFRLLPDDR